MAKVPETFEPVEPDYLNREYVRPPKKLYRFDKHVSGHNDRFYFEFIRERTIPYISLTSLINATLPKGYNFYEWVARMGEDAQRIKMERAVFGSALHEQSFLPIINKAGYDFDKLKRKDSFGISNFQKLFPREYWNTSTRWYYAFTRSLLSFWFFCQERVEQVIAVEIPLRSKKYGYAGTLDFVCLLRFNGKTVFAIIDLKSFFFTLFSKKESKKFYDSHELQLELQKNLWRENFKELPGKGEKIYLFNFSPNAWRDKPSYTLKNQTKNKFTKQVKIVGGRRYVPLWQLHMSMAEGIDLPKPPDTILDIIGKFDDIRNFNWENHIHTTKY